MPTRNFSKCYIMKIFAIDEYGEEDEQKFYIEATSTAPKNRMKALRYTKDINKPFTIEDNDIDDNKDPNPLYEFIRSVGGMDYIGYEVLHEFSCKNLEEFQDIHQDYIAKYNPPVMPLMSAKFFTKHYKFYYQFIKYQVLEMLVNERNNDQLLHSDD